MRTEDHAFGNQCLCLPSYSCRDHKPATVKVTELVPELMGVAVALELEVEKMKRKPALETILDAMGGSGAG